MDEDSLSKFPVATLVAAATLVAPAPASAAAPADAKVDPRLLQKFAVEDRQTFFVDLADRGVPATAAPVKPAGWFRPTTLGALSRTG